MKIGFMRSCFGCCALRTGVLIIAIVDLIIGTYEIIEFCVGIYLDLHHSHIISNTTYVTPLNIITTDNSTYNVTQHPLFRSRGVLYDDSAFAVIVVGCIDVVISSCLLYVAAFRKYELRVLVFIAAIWSFVFAFLDMVSFAIFITLDMMFEMGSFLFHALLQLFFGYVVLSYFKFMTDAVERGLDHIQMSYYPGEAITDVSEVQMEEAKDERPIMDDQDEFDDDDESRLVVT